MAAAVAVPVPGVLEKLDLALALFTDPAMSRCVRVRLNRLH